MRGEASLPSAVLTQQKPSLIIQKFQPNSTQHAPELTSVLCSQPQHEADGEDLGPRRLPLLDEDAEEEGRVGQQQVLERLEGGADVEEAAVLFAAQEALREEGVAQVAQRVAFRGRGERKMIKKNETYGDVMLIQPHFRL